MTDQENQNNRPIKYAIYKGVNGKFGCFQFQLLPAYKSSKGPEGAVFIEAANATAPNVYDWEHKIVFALSPADIGTFLSGFQSGSCKLLHDPGAGSDRKGQKVKNLDLQAGQNAGTFFLNLSEKIGDEEARVVKIPLNAGEARCIITLLTAALPVMLGWTPSIS